MLSESKRLEFILSEKLDEEERELVSKYIERDPLTQAYNRRKLNRDIILVTSMSDRKHDNGASCIMGDIDYFKECNDDYDHTYGDSVLVSVVDEIKNSLRDYDQLNLYRYGGDEFLILLPDTPLDDAVTIAERTRFNIEKNCGVTCSFGVTHYNNPANNTNNLIKTADIALKLAKTNGKNRVEKYSP